MRRDCAVRLALARVWVNGSCGNSGLGYLERESMLGHRSDQGEMSGSVSVGQEPKAVSMRASARMPR